MSRGAPAIALALVSLTSACSRDNVGSSSSSSSSTFAIATTASAPMPSSSTSSAASMPFVPCDFSWGFHGSVAGQDAFLRLKRTGDSGSDAIVGRYFYAKNGEDIALRGTVSPSNEIALTEGDPKKPTGHFSGGCSVSGSFTGTWKNGQKEGANDFHFERIDTRESPLVATKKLALIRPSKTVGTLGMKECTYKQSDVEIFGAATPEAERALNASDATSLAPRILAQETYDDASACESGVDADFVRQVIATWKGFVNIEESGTYNYDGSAHPGNAIGFSRTTYDLHTGKGVTEKDVFTTLPADLVERCVASYPKVTPEGTIGDEVDGHTFALTKRGVHIFAGGYPFVAAVLTGRGPVLSYGALLKEHALRADSPVRRAWEGVSPAKPGEPECLTDEPAGAH